MSKPLTLAEIDACQRIGRNEESRYSTIALTELDALCDTARLAHTNNRIKHSHYFKSVKGLNDIDVYRVLQLFNVTDPCLQHSIKKLLVAGGRDGGKDITRDIQEAIDTLVRWQEMRSEEVKP